LVALALLFLLFPGADVRAREREGEQRFEKRIGDAVVTVVAYIREGRHCLNPEDWVWGSDQECPRTVIAALTVGLGEQVIFVPVSAYGDLANLRSIAAHETADGFEVHFSGGDAASAYNATLDFQRDAGVGFPVLRARKVRSGEFPTEAWEETRYRFRSPTDVEAPIQ
jgi:hypothetical protein